LSSRREGLSRVLEQINARDVVMVADLGAAHAGEKFLCPIRTGAVRAVGFLVIDALHFEAAVKIVGALR
jgi:hypothetical protein